MLTAVANPTARASLHRTNAQPTFLRRCLELNNPVNDQAMPVPAHTLSHRALDLIKTRRSLLQGMAAATARSVAASLCYSATEEFDPYGKSIWWPPTLSSGATCNNVGPRE